MRRRDFTRTALTFGALAPALGQAWAVDKFPSRPIRIVVGFPAGQSSDVGARIIASRLTDLGQPVVVDNKAGASGIIAHEIVKSAAPDGYTLLISSTAPLAINPALYRKLPYETLRDFTPIVLINTSAMYLVTAPSSPFGNLRELIAYARANPGKISYGSSGSGTTGHIAMEMLKKETGLDMVHVPYKGSPGMITDLISGNVQLGFDSSSSITPQLVGGRLKAIGMSDVKRSQRFPDVPTIAEQGVPGFQALTWLGLLGPANLPPAIVEKLNTSVNLALKTREVQDHFINAGSTVNGGSSAEFNKFLHQEVQRWGPATIASGARVD